MKVKNARAAELSDYEVLNMLREMSKKQQAAFDGGQAGEGGKADLGGRGGGGDSALHEATLSAEERTMSSLPSNLRTIQYEVLETLGNVQRPCAHQSAEQIPRFMDALYAWERGRAVEGVTDVNPLTQPIEREKRLTKGERLMMVNHAPTTDIELFTLVEEIEERFTPDDRRDLLAIVAALLPLDQDAMQAAQVAQLASTLDGGTDDVQLDGEGEGKVYVGHGEEDEGIQEDEDMDMLENEVRGEAAVEEEGPDDE